MKHETPLVSLQVKQMLISITMVHPGVTGKISPMAKKTLVLKLKIDPSPKKIDQHPQKTALCVEMFDSIEKRSNQHV